MNKATSREEIEHLLNQTGRTLEKLPAIYSNQEAAAAISVAGKTRFQIGNMLLHQSDVIELMIGALRDALEDQTKEISDAKFEEFSKKAREMAMRRHT